MPSLGGEQSQAAGGKHHGFRHRRSRISNRPWIQQEQPQGKSPDRPTPTAISLSMPGVHKRLAGDGGRRRPRFPGGGPYSRRTRRGIWVQSRPKVDRKKDDEPKELLVLRGQKECADGVSRYTSLHTCRCL